jgi:hypothetical protein
MRIVLVSLAVLGLGAGLAGCRHQADAMTVPMRWADAPSDLRIYPASGVELMKQHAISLQPFTDEREDKVAVGMNVENNHKAPVSTKDDVAAFLTGRFAEVLHANGVESGAANADRVISVAVQRFYVMESNLYEGDVALSVTVADAGGRVLWHGVVEGKSKRFGRSFAADNYQESLTSASIEAFKNLGEKPDFFDSFK